MSVERRRTRAWWAVRAAVAGVAVAGGTTPGSAQSPPLASPPAPKPLKDPYALAGAAVPTAGAPASTAAPRVLAAADAAPQVLLIDLPSALRLTDVQSPTIGLAQARYQEALARLDQASILYLPTITVGGSYFRHDGVDQNRRGDVFSVSRSNLLVGAAIGARFDIADALYLPLVARRLSDAAAANTQAVRNATQYDAASAYLDLLREHGALGINADTLARAEQMLDRAAAADKAGLSKTAGDINRARTEVELRRQERITLQGRIGAASARLARVLFLTETVDLRPAETAVVPVTLVPAQPLESLVALGLANNPDLAVNRALVSASEQRLRQARAEPCLPKVGLEYRGGGFAPARNANFERMDGQQEVSAQVFWQFDNLGLGNRAQVNVRRAELSQSRYRELEAQAEVRARVLESAKLASARFASLDAAQEGVRQATELYRKLQETSFGMVDRKVYDALEPLTAIQQLNQIRTRYLEEVIEYNRAQFRLYAALGQPSAAALATASPQPVQVPVVPVAPPPAAPAQQPPNQPQ